MVSSAKIPSRDTALRQPASIHRPIHFFSAHRSYAILTVFAILAMSIAFLMFSYTQKLLEDRLQEKLTALAATAAVQFDPIDIASVQTPEDIATPAMERIVRSLQGIRDANADVQFTYLMRRTDDPDTLAFVADADSLIPEEEWDIDGNGAISSEEEIPLPGDPYPIDDYPVLRDSAFYEPSVDRELQPDQWGLMMAAYAPIYDAAGNAIAIVGMDVLVGEYLEKIQATFLPFILFILFLLFALTLMTLLLVRFWRERIEVMHEIDRQKDELLSIVSHQLAAPITSLRWYGELLLDRDLGELNKDQEEHLQTMQSVVCGLTELVSMILDVSRIQLGRMKVDRRDLDLAALFHEILSIVLPGAKDKNVRIIQKFPSVWPHAMLDKRLTHMTIENLLTNAVKYTPKGGEVRFTVKVINGTLHCIVADTGYGIPKVEQEKIFSRLFRASNIRETVAGNGLGLYVAKGAVESQGGTVSFESEEGKGTIFTVTLPLQKGKSS